MFTSTSLYKYFVALFNNLLDWNCINTVKSGKFGQIQIMIVIQSQMKIKKEISKAKQLLRVTGKNIHSTHSLCFQTFDSFVFIHFNSNILYSICFLFDSFVFIPVFNFCKFRLLLKMSIYLLIDFTKLTFLASKIDSVQLSQS